MWGHGGEPGRMASSGPGWGPGVCFLPDHSINHPPPPTPPPLRLVPGAALCVAIFQHGHLTSWPQMVMEMALCSVPPTCRSSLRAVGQPRWPCPLADCCHVSSPTTGSGPISLQPTVCVLLSQTLHHSHQASAQKLQWLLNT